MLNAKLYRDGVITETTDAILTAMRHGIIDPECSVRDLLVNYADRLEIAIRREKDDVAATKICASAKEDGCPDTDKRSGLSRVIDMPEIGLQFERIKSNDITYFIGKWQNEMFSHVYTLRVQRIGCMWTCKGENDGRHIFTLHSPSRQLCEKLGFAALRKYIRIGHRRTLKRLKKNQKEGADGPAA
jgi:hypothetical protein